MFSLINLCNVHSLGFLVLMQLLTIISTIDDLNYPEKTNAYYIVNAPYIFSACWKVSLSMLFLVLRVAAVLNFLLDIVLVQVLHLFTGTRIGYEITFNLSSGC